MLVLLSWIKYASSRFKNKFTKTVVEKAEYIKYLKKWSVLAEKHTATNAEES